MNPMPRGHRRLFPALLGSLLVAFPAAQSRAQGADPSENTAQQGKGLSEGQLKMVFEQGTQATMEALKEGDGTKAVANIRTLRKLTGGVSDEAFAKAITIFAVKSRGEGETIPANRIDAMLQVLHDIKDSDNPLAREAARQADLFLHDLSGRKDGALDGDPAAKEYVLGNPDLRREMTRTWTKRGRHRNVLEATERSLKDNPEDSEAMHHRADAYHGLGDNKKALAAVDESLKRDADNSNAWTLRASANMQLGNLSQARTDAARALALNPQDKAALAILSLSREAPASDLVGIDAQADRVRNRLQGQADDFPRRTPPPDKMGSLRQAGASLPVSGSGDASEAGGQPIAVRAQTFYKQALTQMQLGDGSGAIESAGTAIRLSPGSPQPYAVRAAAYNAVKDYASAYQDASKALELDPKNLPALLARAWSLNQMGRSREALGDARGALRLAPNDSYAYYNKALAEQKLGLWEEMMPDFAAAAELNPEFRSHLESAAAVYQENTGRAFVFDGSARPFPSAAGGRGGRPQTTSPGQKNRLLVSVVATAVGGGLIAFFLLDTFSRRRSGRPPQADATTGTGSAALLGGNYAVVRELGRGGMGIVYEALDNALGRTVAIKKMKEEIRLNPRDKDRFIQEARLVAALKHPGLVEIYSIFEENDALFLVFEFVPGMTLDEHLYRTGPVSPARARELLRPVCDALAYAHEHKVIHRDLKLSNIMLADDGQVKVMDFGLARQAKDTLARLSTTDAGGTPAYMAPEQERGVVRRESDIFMLGGCLYELLTGRPPFAGGHLQLQKLDQAFRDPSELVPGLPRELDAVVRKALAPDPDARYHTPREFLAALDAAVGGTVPQPPSA